MSNNKLIGKCKNCDQDYCMECSNHIGWDLFCSDACRDDDKDKRERKILKEKAKTKARKNISYDQLTGGF